MRKTPLTEIVQYCETRLNSAAFVDFPGAFNGLQLANASGVSKIGAAVDAGLVPFQKAAALGIDFLIVHHGIFWSDPRPITGLSHERLRAAMMADCAVYSAHLPLDAHPEIGNNARIAQQLGLQAERTFCPVNGRDIGLIVGGGLSRSEIAAKLQREFPKGFSRIECGSETPRAIAIVSGSGSSTLEALVAAGVDTLITGELRQSCFNFAQENRLNLYACGHYATETYGVCALAAEVAAKYGLPWEFIQTECPL